MALTEVVRLRLEAAGFKDLFDKNKKDWEELAERAKTVIGMEVAGHDPTIDDIRKVALPLIELNPHLRDFIAKGKGKFSQKFWVTDFTDYVLDRVYQPTLKQP